MKSGKDVNIIKLSPSLKIADSVREWVQLSDSAMRLRCGEMTAQEIRTVRAVLHSILTN